MTPGIHNIPMAEYLADPCPEPSLSSSCLHTLLSQSPRHAWWSHPRLGGHSGDHAKKADMGTVAHDLLLGGEGTIVVLDPEDYAGKTGAAPKGWTNDKIRGARDAIRAAGKTPILKDDAEEAKLMAAAARAFIAQSELVGVFDEGQAELTLIAQEGPLWLRARPDWLNPVQRVMLHYKTTLASVEPSRFIRGVMQGMGYGTAVAFYAHVLDLVLPGESHAWQHVILAQEQAAPYACSLIALDPTKMAVEAENVARGIGVWEQCMRTGYWPAYPGQIHYAAPSAWELSSIGG